MKRFFLFSILTLALPISIMAEGDKSAPKLKITGYGELIYSHFDYGPDQKLSGFAAG